ncbi:MAG: hypothetical protein L0177_04090 [Chloroflexi bacterium]|nr:hypothetical protein [Chloroflexota bacterium]
MEQVSSGKPTQGLETFSSSVRRRLLQGALQPRPDRTLNPSTALRTSPSTALSAAPASAPRTGHSKPAVQFTEPERERGVQGLARDIRGIGIGSEFPALVRVIDLLCEELEARRREIQELHILLRQSIDSNTRRPWWAQAVTPYWSAEEQPQQG